MIIDMAQQLQIRKCCGHGRSCGFVLLNLEFLSKLDFLLCPQQTEKKQSLLVRNKLAVVNINVLLVSLPSCVRVNYPYTCFVKFIFSFHSVSKYSFQ